MARVYTGDELARRVFLIVVLGVCMEIAAMLLIGL